MTWVILDGLALSVFALKQAVAIFAELSTSQVELSVMRTSE